MDGELPNDTPQRGIRAKNYDSYLSVSQLLRMINDVFDLEIPTAAFRGEVSQLQTATSGHLYFTLKDETGQVSCVMWASNVRQLPVRPTQGLKVRCIGKPNVYAGTGRFQIVVHRLELDGEGELRKRFLELKARLDREGFFAPERKRPLPFFPRAIGIVTSQTGAVIHDMMVKITERLPIVPVYLADTRVQGDGAAVEIAAAIDRLGGSGLVDVVIVARGGGSLEDLWAFNEEEVVKAIFRCPVPVISGVGHEVDITLADFVADVRAPTPTAAAEMVVPHREELLRRVEDSERRLHDLSRWYQVKVQAFDDLTMRLEACIGRVWSDVKLRMEVAASRVKLLHPSQIFERSNSKLDSLRSRLAHVMEQQRSESGRRIERLEDRLSSSMRRLIERRQSALQSCLGRFHSVDPKKVLGRGFAILRGPAGIVRDPGDVNKGDRVRATVVGGELALRVTDD